MLGATWHTMLWLFTVPVKKDLFRRQTSDISSSEGRPQVEVNTHLRRNIWREMQWTWTKRLMKWSEKCNWSWTCVLATFSRQNCFFGSWNQVKTISCNFYNWIMFIFLIFRIVVGPVPWNGGSKMNHKRSKMNRRPSLRLSWLGSTKMLNI